MNQLNTAGSVTGASRVTWRVIFCENVCGVDTADLAFPTRRSSDLTIASVSAGSGTTIDVTVNGVGGDGTLRLDLNSSGTGIQDDAANPIGDRSAEHKTELQSRAEPA